MTLKRDDLVFPPKISKPLGREKFFQLQVGREECSTRYRKSLYKWHSSR